MTGDKIRWGLLGAGSILSRWMKGFAEVNDAEIVAVASRTIASAEKAKETYGLPLALSYDELLARDDIDVVYIPVPHRAHKELAIRAMNAGKAVLVEKPAAVTAADFDEMAACAKENNVFLCEAVWTRCFPVLREIKKRLADGVIGDVRLIESAFTYRMGDDYHGWAFDPNEAGGGLLDVGVYNLHFADAILEKAPVAVRGLASVDTDHLHLQVDEQAAYVAQYDQGELALMISGVRTEHPAEAKITGTRGQITFPCFYKPTEAVITTSAGTETLHEPASGNDEGYQYEIRHVNECLRQGLKESPLIPHACTRTVLKTCDELRKQWGLSFPFET